MQSLDSSIHNQVNTVPRPEYPRPQWIRTDWVNLNGTWEFMFDDENIGLEEKWYLSPSFSKKIVVPFAYTTKDSGIHETDFHDVVWYSRTFSIQSNEKDSRVILHFGAVDYTADVWVNGSHVATHEGGHVPFSVDITNFLNPGNENGLVVRAEDVSDRLDQPRGKQYWKEKSESIFYTRTTGIWQTVWLEVRNRTHIDNAFFTPDVDSGEIQVDVHVVKPNKGHRLFLDIKIDFESAPVASDTVEVYNADISRRLNLNDFNVHSQGRLWSPDNPNLYSIEFTLRSEHAVLDRVSSYFGMRKISIENGKVFLNNKPFYMKMVLDQGYFSSGGLTPPSDDAIQLDIKLTKQMGFNGVRKHQKVEDPRFLYWCDKVGLVVWGEMANAYTYTPRAVRSITQEWQEVIRRDYNHPCIIVWVPINESWGVPRLLSDPKQRAHIQSLYYLTKSIDTTRLVLSNDGWEHGTSDLCTIHDYESDGAVLRHRYSSQKSAIDGTPGYRLIYAPGFSFNDAPILVTEFGGISFKTNEWDGWGYSGAETAEDFVNRYKAVVEALLASPTVQGFCYTQLTDVEQEINGLLTYDRKPKVKLEVIRNINSGFERAD